MAPVISLLIKYRYLVLFPLACIEGPVLALIAGYMIHLGYLSPLPTIFIFILGDFFPDILYFYAGRFANRKNYLQRLLKISEDKARLFRVLWEKHTGKAVFLGKLSYGLSIPVIISAGMAGVPYKKFLSYSIPTSFFQYSILMTIGYYIGYAATQLQGYVRSVGLIIAALFIVLAVIYIRIAKYAKHEIEEIRDESQAKE